MNCQNIYDICRGNCTTSYVLTPTLNDPICHAGISFLSLYALPCLAFMGVYPITKIQNYIVRQLNNTIEDHFKTNTTGYSLNDKVSSTAMRFWWSDIKDNKTILSKLSVEQTLAIAPLYSPCEFKLMAQEHFTHDAAIVASKLSLLLERDLDKLTNAINDETLIKWFIAYPMLLETLIQLLPDNHLDDKDLAQGFGKLFDEILDEPLDEAEINTIIYHIKNGGYLSKTSFNTNACFNILCNDETISIDKELLQNVSAYFQGHERINSKHNDIDLSHIDARWVNILIDEALGNAQEIKDNNIIDYLNAANYFTINTLQSKLDNYMAEYQLLPYIIRYHAKQENNTINIDINNLFYQYQFCNRYGLVINKQNTIKEILKLFDNMEDLSHNLLDDLRKITAKDIAEVLPEITFTNFLNRLKNPMFLSAIWDNAHDLYFIRDMIVNFCQDHTKVLEMAFVVIPKELHEALTPK